MIDISTHLLEGNFVEAKKIASIKYPFETRSVYKRQYSKKQMLEVFIKDGFIDRYSGAKLYHPGFLRMLHILLPDEFPFHPHGKANECHNIFWDSLPSIDHFVSLYRGGKDEIENYVTTSMKRNLAKNNWTIEEIGWKLFPSGKMSDWDGQSRNFLLLVEKFQPDNQYIKEWYRITNSLLGL